MSAIVQVAVGIVQQQQQVLLTSRPVGKSYASYWEFPGGKLELGEDAVTALIRELAEEINIQVLAAQCSFLTKLQHSYAQTTVELHVINVASYTGVARGMEGQQLYWQDINLPCQLKPLLPTSLLIFDILNNLPLP